MTDVKFVNAYGEQMTANEMIQQLMKRVSDLEKQTKETTKNTKSLREDVMQLAQHANE